MSPTLRAPVLVPGVATGIGSLPHDDPVAAAEVVLRCLPELPAAPQLPARDPREGMLAQWLGALPEVTMAADGGVVIVATTPTPRPTATSATVGTTGSGDVPRGRRGPREAAGPGEGAGDGPADPGRGAARGGRPGAAGVPTRRRGHPCVVGGDRGTGRRTTLPDAGLVLFFDEPALVSWQRGDEPLDRESAIDVLSGALAAVDCVTGVHVCGDGDVALALEAGPEVLGVEVSDELVRHTVSLARFLDGDGWIAWGAVPTDRPVGESADPHWRTLARVWCDLTRRGCDPVPLRTRGLITPGVRAGGLRCLAGRACARHRTRVGRPGARPGGRRATHAGSLTWRPPRTATAACAASRSSRARRCAGTVAPRSRVRPARGRRTRRCWRGRHRSRSGHR